MLIKRHVLYITTPKDYPSKERNVHYTRHGKHQEKEETFKGSVATAIQIPAKHLIQCCMY